MTVMTYKNSNDISTVMINFYDNMPVYTPTDLRKNDIKLYIVTF